MHWFGLTDWAGTGVTLGEPYLFSYLPLNKGTATTSINLWIPENNKTSLEESTTCDAQ